MPSCPSGTTPFGQPARFESHHAPNAVADADDCAEPLGVVLTSRMRTSWVMPWILSWMTLAVSTMLNFLEKLARTNLISPLILVDVKNTSCFIPLPLIILPYDAGPSSWCLRRQAHWLPPTAYLLPIYRYMQQNISMSLEESDSGQPHPSQYFPDSHIKNTEDEQINYYNEYCRLFLANHVLATQLKELNIEKADLVSKLAKLEKKAEELSEGNSGQIDEKKRRIRRSAVDIARHYKCQMEGCTKSYGSEGSLNQHIKLKHPEVFRGNEKDFVVKQYDNEEDESP